MQIQSSIPNVQKPVLSSSESVTIHFVHEAFVALPKSAFSNNNVGVVSSLSNCIVNMSPPTFAGRAFATMAVKDVQSCLVVVGRVNGPIHITKMRNSILVVACRQFRMHESSNCDVYLSASSLPVIEDCSGIRFAPIPFLDVSAYVNPAFSLFSYT